ncbi:restriction endonuclease subunit S [Bacteroides thetaiotaomicron]|uniref:restriction endonuclease subunit S n=1 Tax=Bacteroides thetaiotaomicron TaxID=818 RepID=UPI0021662217|nr:restriction endonuclease subunit S [Bacteroides thetaiotaomicron]MCS2716195.1 restriction endonuclease subunit S [Bacteroides thetaiotaomicron]MCS2876554.1 restriction endonuclease subunit S [Bacteroides thetaiotaomicron]
MTKYKFDEIAINSTQKKKPTEDDKVYYIGLEHIDPGCFDVVRWGSDVAPTGDKLLMQKGDVLFGKRRAYQRKVAIAPFDGIFSAHGMVLRPNLKVIDANYFPFFISSDKFMETAVRISVGGLSPTINWKDLARQEFELPSLDEQKVLSDKLWAAYRLKEAYKKLLVATDEMVKSQFIEMFGGESNKVPFEEIVVVKDDCRRPINEGVRSEMKDGELYPYYGATGVVDYINDYLTDDELLCIAEDCGNYNAGEESAYIIRGKAWVNNHAHLVKTKEACDVKYLYYFLKIADLKPYVSGTTRLKLTQKKLKKISVTLPSTDKQKTFVKIAEQADKSKFELRKSIDAIDKVIKSLINN